LIAIEIGVAKSPSHPVARRLRGSTRCRYGSNCNQKQRLLSYRLIAYLCCPR